MKNSFDLIIIGGGAAGIMATISAKRQNPDLQIAIIDRTFALGRKILVAGAGRCNVTNVNLNNSLEKNFFGADKDFIKSIFDQFSYQEIVKFFEDLGIELYIERKTNIGKLFPITDQAKTVTSLLEDELSNLKVKIFLNTDCHKILKQNNVFKISATTNQIEEKTQQKQEFISKYLIISAGGKTYPTLGSNGSGYSLARSFGHTIIEPVPSALPLVGKNPLSKEIQGVKMEIEATSIIENNEVKTSTDDVMFTQYGLSGPAILNISREISIHINRNGKNNAFVKLNFLPGKSKNEVKELLKNRWKKRPNQRIEFSLFGLFPNKVPAALLKTIGIDKEQLVGNLTEKEIDLVCETLTNFRVKITNTMTWNEAEFTAGGVDTREVKPFTLESKKMENLYFCGEILDVDGAVGGFNLSWAWSSGFVAGKLQKVSL